MENDFGIAKPWRVGGVISRPRGVIIVCDDQMHICIGETCIQMTLCGRGKMQGTSSMNCPLRVQDQPKAIWQVYANRCGIVNPWLSSGVLSKMPGVISARRVEVCFRCGKTSNANIHT